MSPVFEFTVFFEFRGQKMKKKFTARTKEDAEEKARQWVADEVIVHEARPTGIKFFDFSKEARDSRRRQDDILDFLKGKIKI